MKSVICLAFILFTGLSCCIAQQFKTILEEDREYTLELLSIDADIEVTTHQVSEINISCTSFPTVPEKAQGLRPLMTKSGVDNTGISLNMKITDSIITLSGGHYTENQTYHIIMPDDVNLVIRYTDNTVPFDIDIKDLASKIKVSIYQGNIQAESISGPVDLRTDRGNITVLFSEIQQDEPMDVYCRNGDVDITLSKEEPVTFKMRSQAGDIYTDLLIEEAEAEDTLFYEGLSIGSKDGKDLWTYRLDPAKSVEMLSYDGIESITVDKDSGRIVITNKQSGQDMQDKIYDFDGYTGNDTTNIYFHYDKVLSLKRSADEWNFIIGQPSYDFKGHLNGGGVEFGIRTGEGNIYLRSIR